MGAVLFGLLGKLVVPRFDELNMAMGEERGNAAPFFLFFSGLLLLALVARLVYRWRSR